MSKITNVGFHGKPLFFFFGTWFHGLLFEFWVVSQKCWQKIWYFGGFMKCKNKINWNHLVPRMGPRAFFASAAQRRRPRWKREAPAAGAAARRRRKYALGPILGTRWFQFFFFCISWIPPKYQIFLPTFLWIPPKIQTIIHEYQVTKKKIWVVYHEIQHWWFWTNISSLPNSFAET